MSISLLASVLILGLLVSPHCAGMCGCGLAQPWLNKTNTKIEHLCFQVGRVLAYTTLGIAAGWGSAVFQAVALQATGFLHAVWWMFHAALFFLALFLIFATKPPIMNGFVSVHFSTKRKRSKWRSFRGGLLWLAMPCGLLYAALTLAYLSASPISGGVMMALFGVITTLSLSGVNYSRAWIQKHFSEQAMHRASGVFILLGLVLMTLQKIGVLLIPNTLENLSICL